MKNICQAIEEELNSIQIAEDNGKDIYRQQKNSGMSVALWREILSNPETMRIETSLDFAETSMNLVDDLLGKDVDDKYFTHDYMIESPVILYIPDLKDPEHDRINDGVFVFHWLEKNFEMSGTAHHAWVQFKNNSFKKLTIPMSADDIEHADKKQLDKKNVDGFQEELQILHFALAAVIYMIKRPNFVTQTTVSNSGGVRKRLEKKKGIPRDRWSRIQWNVGQNVQREVRKTMGEEHCTALHRVRGFYRKAESHYNNVTKIEGKWFQWIEPFWRGHPAFGIIKSTYAPKIEDIKL
tara:strand:+ start:881 stop:1765 length:885 start_codon:yes stop_codon:yes gene_type:complete